MNSQDLTIVAIGSNLGDSCHIISQIIPRLQSAINTYYPGTKIALTEYNYGGAHNISGGIAQADVLGIFGKQGVYAAAEWPLASNESSSFIGGAFLV